MENPGNYSSNMYPYDDYYYNYEYNYTYEDSMNYLPLDELIPSLTFYVLIGLLGLAGNILVIVAILAFPRMKSITNVFLLSLASADLLLVLICVPIKVFIIYLFLVYTILYNILVTTLLMLILKYNAVNGKWVFMCKS